MLCLGNCIAQNFLVYVMGAMAVLLCLTGVSCVVTGRNGYLVSPGTTGIDDYGGNAVRVLSPFDDEQEGSQSGGVSSARVQDGAGGDGDEEEGEIIEAALFVEEEEDDDKEEAEALSAEIIPAPTGRPSL